MIMKILSNVTRLLFEPTSNAAVSALDAIEAFE